MGKQGYSATTAVLVAVLVGALYMVGRTVTPPPPGPPEPPPVRKVADPHAKGLPGPGPGSSPAERARLMKMMEDKEKQKHGVPIHSKPIKKKTFDPNTIEVKPGWTKDGRLMGAQGEAQLREMVRKANEAEAAERLLHSPAAPTPNAATPPSGAAPKSSP